jgi:putative flippase GtrA
LRWKPHTNLPTLTMNKHFLFKLFKFGIVGISGIVVDYSTTIFFKEIVGINKYAANSCGFAFAATTNYIINRKWTFKSNNPDVLKEFLLFAAIATAGLFINNSIIWLLHDYLKFFDFYVSKLMAIGVVFFWNFFMNSRFNFGKP